MTTPITGETWGDEIERVRTFLSREAERPIAELRPKLDEARNDLLAAVDGLDSAEAEVRPESGEAEEAWGIAEVLRHIVSVEAIMADRIRQLGVGQPVNITTTYPGYMESIETRSLPALLDALGESFDLLLGAVAGIEGKERVDTFDAHRRFGELNCRSWLAMHTLHLKDHARQVAKLRASLTGSE